MSSARRSSTVDRRRLLAGVAGLATLACAPGASVAGASVAGASGAGASGAGASGAEASGAEAAAKGGSGEWRAYGATNAATKYSPLSQIDATNVANLRIAWEWESPDAAIIEANPGLAPGEFQATPIMADGVLYTSTAFCQVVAIDPATGRNIWVHDPGTWKRGKYTSKGMQHRGVAYWRDGDDARVIIGTGDNRLIALDARTGEPIESFGKGGEVDLGVVGLQRPLARDPVDLFASTSPPTICRDVIVMGQYIHDRVVASEMPPGDVRGFDVRTGELKWTFHTVPMEGEFGWDTWENGSAARNGNANVWAPMAADDELGLVYLPGSCPTNNFYGGDRPGDNLFGNALICLDVKTGERRWHYQFVRHDVWDLDLPCAPNLVDIRIGRRRIKAVAQVTKHGFTFVFDRVTGRPIWPIEDRPVPASTIKGEKLSPTQPFPTKPPPFEPQGMTQEMLIDWTPELREEAQAIMAEYKTGPLFTPFSDQLTIQRPAWGGGANWGGAAVDPETGVLCAVDILRRRPGPGRRGQAGRDGGDGGDRRLGASRHRAPRPAAGQAALRPDHGHRPQPRRDPLDEAQRTRRQRNAGLQGPRHRMGRLDRAHGSAAHEDPALPGRGAARPEFAPRPARLGQGDRRGGRRNAAPGTHPRPAHDLHGEWQAVCGLRHGLPPLAA